MATLFFKFNVHAQLDGAGNDRLSLGDFAVPIKVTVAGQQFHQTHSIAGSTTVTLFDATQDLADFDFLLIRADGELIVELVTDQNAGVGTEQYTVTVNGGNNTGEFGVPFVLANDQSYANYTINFGGGTLDVIDLIRARNLGTSAVKCEIFAVT
jgi:hypothetical protein